MGFLDAEFKRARERRRTQDFCTITDSLALARAKYPGQKNSLDALCKRLGIDNSARTLHGALLDAEILAEVYLALTGGQASLGLDAPEERAATEDRESEMRKVQRPASLRVTEPNEAELRAHEQMLKKLASESGEARHW